MIALPAISKQSITTPSHLHFYVGKSIVELFKITHLSVMMIFFLLMVRYEFAKPKEFLVFLFSSPDAQFSTPTVTRLNNSSTR